MTVIHPNSISGIASVTSHSNSLYFYESDHSTKLTLNAHVNGNVTGDITATNGTFSGDVTVGGTLTYDDVTNIDSVGVITARAGVNISGGNLQVGGTNVINSGRVLYNLEQLKLADTKELVLGSGNDLKIQHSGSHSFISQEGAGALKIKGDDIRFEDAGGTEALRIDSSGRLLIGRTSTSHEHPLQVQAANGANAIAIQGRSADDQSEITFYENDNTTITAQIQQLVNRSIFRHRVGYIRFDTGGTSEKMRLDANGYLGINNSAPHNQYYNNLVIGDGSASGDKGITIRTQSSNEGVIAFSDADSGAARYAGKIAYNHGNNAMMFFTTNGDERLRIDSSGFIKQKFTSNNSTTAEGLFINNLNNGTGNNASLILSNDSGERKKAAIALIDTGNYGAGDLVFALDGADSGELHLTNDEKLRITSAGLVGVNCTNIFSQFQVKAGTNANIGLTVMSNEAAIEAFNDAGSSSVPLRLRGSALKAYTSSTERLQIYSDGRVRIRGINANSTFTVSNTSGTVFILDDTEPSAVGTGGKIVFGSKYYNASNTMGTAFIGSYKENAPSNGSNEYDHSLIFGTNSHNGFSERMRIRHDGRVHIGDSLGNNHSGMFQVIHEGGGNQTNDCLAYFETNANDWILKLNSNEGGSASHYHMYFMEEGSARGAITGGHGQNVNYQQGSDYRWKENIVDMTGTEGIDICKRLRPRKYNWIKNREGTGQINTVDGFIAHEVQEAGVLGAVTGEKDAVNEDGSINGQMLDYGQMTPVLAAAIKGLIAKVETLEAQVTALQG